MTHDEIIIVLQAHKEGKPIEWLSKKSKWESCEQVSLEAILHDIINNEINYRVAPEPPKPEYVPWNTIEEVIPHMSKVFVSKKDRSYVGVITYANGNNREILVIQGGRAKDFFENYEFLDGTPCGKKLVEK